MTKIANRIHLLYFLCRKKYIVMKTNAVLWNRNPSRLMAKNGIGLRFCRYSMELINSRMDRLLRIRSVLSTIPLKEHYKGQWQIVSVPCEKACHQNGVDNTTDKDKELKVGDNRFTAYRQ